MKIQKLIISSAGFSILTACASAPANVVELDAVQFKGDSFPAMTSSDLKRSDYSKLSEGETVIVAIADDNSGAVSHPNLASASITEVIAKNSEKSMELLRSQCDVDSDGIWDSYCPELISELRESENFVMFKSNYTISQTTSGRDDWSNSTSIDRNEFVDKTQPIYVRLLTVNEGNKAFTGDLNIIVNIPPQVEFKQIKELYKVKSNAGTKAVVGGLVTAMTALSGVPIYATTGDVGWIKDFDRQKSYDDFSITNTNKKLNVTANNVSIEPNEGMELIYEVSYEYLDK